MTHALVLYETTANVFLGCCCNCSHRSLRQAFC